MTTPASRVTAEKSEVPMGAPFVHGDYVILKGVGAAIVKQCFLAVGGWRVIAKGPWSRANVHGLYDFPTEVIVKAEGHS